MLPEPFVLSERKLMIRTMFKLATAVLVVTALVALPGCGGSKSPASSGTRQRPVRA